MIVNTNESFSKAWIGVNKYILCKSRIFCRFVIFVSCELIVDKLSDEILGKKLGWYYYRTITVDGKYNKKYYSGYGFKILL